MSIGLTQIDSNSGGGGATDTTGSGSPTGNSLQLFALCLTDFLNAGTVALSGAMTTWTEVARVNVVGNSLTVIVWRALEASPAGGQVTITYTGDTPTSSWWSWSEYSGVKTSGVNGADAVPAAQVATNTATGTTVTVTIPGAFDSANSWTWGAFAFGGGTASEGAAFTVIDIRAAVTVRGLTEYEAGNDASVVANRSSSGSLGGIGLEIVAATASVGGSITAGPAGPIPAGIITG